MNENFKRIIFRLILLIFGICFGINDAFAQKTKMASEVDLNAPPVYAVWRDSMTELKVSLQVLKDKNGSLEQENEFLRNELSNLQDKLNKVQRGQVVSNERFPAEVVTVDVLPEEAKLPVIEKAPPESVSEAKKQKVALKDEILIRQKRLKQLENEGQTLRNKISTLQKKLKTAEKKREVDTKVFAKQAEEKQQRQKQMEDFLAKQEELKKQWVEATNNSQKISEEIKQMAVKNQPLPDEQIKILKELTSEIKTLNSRNQDLKRRLKIASEDAKKAESQITIRVAAEEKKWSEKAANIQKENENLRNEIVTLTQMMEGLKVKKAQVEALLEKSNP